MNKLFKFSCALCLLLAHFAANAIIYTVNSNGDSGTGSGTSGDLRYCIIQVNATVAGAPHTIHFNIPGTAPFIISVSSDLPAVTRAGTVIDATTQPGFSPANIPVVYIESGSGGVNGVWVNNAANTEIYGLQIYNFDNGIYISGDAADGFIIGAPNKKNVINRCNYYHIFIESADNGAIQSNNIGCDLTGTFGYTPSQAWYSPNGLYFLNSANNNMIGGVVTGEGNIIAGSAGAAVYIGEYATSDPSTGSSGNIFYGNTIGGSGTDMAWWSWAFWIDGNSDNNIIGGVLQGQGNNLSNSTTGYTANSYGNLVVGVNEKDATGNQVRGNNMACAYGYGIVLAGSAGSNGNNNIQPPLIDSQMGNLLNGTAPPNSTVDFYTGSLCNDVYGECKSETYLTTVTTDGSGNWNADLSGLSLTCSTDITAVATTAADGSSPFAHCFSFCPVVSDFCDVNGNVAIYSNYDGGIVEINVDQNIPNLKICVCTYEPIQVTIAGPYVSNVTQVVYAGFNSNQNNNNCGQGNFPTSITGVDPGIVTINPPNTPPEVGYIPAHGNGTGSIYGGVVGASGSCDTMTFAGGGNTPDEIVYYFLSVTGGTLLFHRTQYDCWMDVTINLSDGGNCCILPAILPGGCTKPSAASAISGHSSVCTGETTGYSVPSIPNATGYMWILPQGATITAGNNTNNISVNFSTAATSGYISVKGSNACGTGDSSLLNVTVNTAPEAGTVTASRDTICAGTPAILSVSGNSDPVLWQSSLSQNNFLTIAGETNSSYTGVPSQTTYYRAFANNGNCADTTAIYEIVVKPSPAGSFSYNTSGLQVAFNSSGSSGNITLYEWDFGDNTQKSNDENPVHIYSIADTFHVCLTVENGSNCSFTLCRDIITEDLTGTEIHFQNNDCTIFPSVVKDKLSLNCASSGEKFVEIKNILGQTLLVYAIDTHHKTKIDVSGLSAGVYLAVIIKFGKSTIVRKFVKE